MKKRFGYILAVILLSFVYINCNAQDYYQPAVFRNATDPTGKILVFPNPATANSYFNVEIDSSYNLHTVTLIIYNSSGFIKEDKVLKIQEGNNLFEINLAGYDQGNYIVRVVANNPKLFSYSTQLVLR